MKSYEEMKQESQNMYDELGRKGIVKVAFGDKQFGEILTEWGIDKNNEEEIKNKIGHLYAGAYFLKEKEEEINKWLNNTIQEDWLKENGEEAYTEMFNYELANHEFTYTYEIGDTLRACGITGKELRENEKARNGLVKAIAIQNKWHEEKINGEEEKDIGIYRENADNWLKNCYGI